MTRQINDRARELVELKPCPFCGGPATMNDVPGNAWTACRKCNSSSGEFDTTNEAIAAWNTRALTPPEVDTTQWANIKVMLLKRVHEFPWDNAGGPDTFKLVNPDGPAAVAFIERSLTENARLRRKLKEFGCEEVENVDEHIASLTPPEGNTVSEGVNEELLREKLFILSDRLRASGILSASDAVHEAYEAVVAALQSRVSPQANEVERWKQKLLAVASERDRLAQHREQLIEELAEARSSPQEGMREALEEAYEQGALDVHEAWVEGLGKENAPSRDPDFGKAAYDYADAALSTAPIPMSEAERISLENGGDPC